ncbi:unnamed protein product [Boreogadus saida]
MGRASTSGKDSSIQTIYQLSGIVSYLGESIETGLPCDEDSGDSSPEGKRGDGRHFDYFLWCSRFVGVELRLLKAWPVLPKGSLSCWRLHALTRAAF